MFLISIQIFFVELLLKKKNQKPKRYIFLDNKLIKYKSIKFKLKFYRYKMKIITLRINEFAVNFQNSTFIVQKIKINYN